MIEEINIKNLRINNDINLRKTNINEDIDTLVSDIKQNGLLNPLTVIKVGELKYEVCAGQRRLLALQKLGMDKIYCNVLDINKEKATLISLSENIHRNKLCNKDKCNIFSSLLKKYKNVDKVAQLCSYSKNTIKDYIFIEENLEPELIDKLDAIGDEKLPVHLAYFIAKNIPKENQKELYTQLIALGSTDMKKQAIMNFKNLDKEEEEEEVKGDEPVTKEEKGDKDDNDEKIKIPKKPWVFDEDNNPLVIPKEFYMDVLQLLRDRGV
jgi:ParB/RepB/Spo0J family partition protein